VSPGLGRGISGRRRAGVGPPGEVGPDARRRHRGRVAAGLPPARGHRPRKAGRVPPDQSGRSIPAWPGRLRAGHPPVRIGPPVTRIC